MDIAQLLALTKEKQASDLHLTPLVPPCLRVHGSIVQTDLPPLERKQLREMLLTIMTEDQKARFDTDHEIDFSVELEGIARYRVNVFLTHRGEAAAFRLIPEQIPSIDELGLPKQVLYFTTLVRGLVLVTGPTGSGKSTTLASLIDIINRREQGHIITLEDPIEYVHVPRKSIINQREVGNHTNSFANALRSALREDPDVILVGEMRDLETIQLAIRAAETGHLVFATLHTASAGRTLDRIVDVFPADQQEQIRVQLAETVEGVLSQTLLQTIDGNSRVMAMEVMLTTPAIRNLIRERKTHLIPNTIQMSNSQGMQSLDQALMLLVRDGKISREAAMQKAQDRENFEQLMSGKTPSINTDISNLESQA